MIAQEKHAVEWLDTIVYCAEGRRFENERGRWKERNIFWTCDFGQFVYLFLFVLATLML